MDVNTLKGRIAEAFVEAIFRRAGYRVSRAGRETTIPRLVRMGPDAFLPDFLIWKPVESQGSERPLHRMFAIEVKYRASLAEFLRREGEAIVTGVRGDWPELCFVLVTDRPDAGRSCFQVIDVREYAGGGEPKTIDLHCHGELNVWEKTVQEYEALVKQIFPLLAPLPADERA